MSEGGRLVHEIFNEQSAILAGLGALGGAVRAATLKTTWKEGLRVTFIGSATAFGVGALGPFLLRPYIGELPDGATAAFGVLSASAFLIGLIAVTAIERWVGGRPRASLVAAVPGVPPDPVPPAPAGEIDPLPPLPAHDAAPEGEGGDDARS
ncbi:hypothetical protein N0B44_15540 [Roseibacterium beibuensis]|uniref:Uncharacterized protein n=1 Tax=[Roseibacterium] beibuensis TaxID=1193142 RepID=A0ABP9LCI6_9RHOB|nr:hypothetical protein [Roseibacterium beibuensis]MCS6624332.1 hypothetical protein [Roseibacterium beibuensis]